LFIGLVGSAPHAFSGEQDTTARLSLNGRETIAVSMWQNGFLF
jgi:hypothetical protein